jgi:L-fucose mutarotase/ribose pyranase (RbsD/FucU family)
MNTVNSEPAPNAWELELQRRLPLFGHRNWIVIVDAAYPAQSNPGIETFVTGAEHREVVSKVVTALAASPHIRANVYSDAELVMVKESDAPGVTACREHLASLLDGYAIRRLSHEEIIVKLDQCARHFRILILKTTLKIPYTSVFFELDCGYWSAEAEQQLRKAMRATYSS